MQSRRSPSRLGASFLLSGALICAPIASAAEPAQNYELRQHTADSMRELLFHTPLIDGHNDVPWQILERWKNALAKFDFADTSTLRPKMHTDLARLEQSGLGGQFWSVYIPTTLAGPGATRAVLEQIDVVHRLVAKHPDRLQIAFTAKDIKRARANHRLASLIGMEGGHAIENSLGALRQLYRAGVRYMTLTHSDNTDWADSATDETQHNGLTPFGKEVVREMNRMGMLVDLSHVSPKTMHDALNVARAPVIFSHSSAYAMTQHARNVPDDVLRRLSKNGGVVMVTFVPPFVSETVRRYRHRETLASIEARRNLLRSLRGKALKDALSQAAREWSKNNPPPRATLTDVANHIDHIRSVAGIEHVGIGGDFDGITTVVAGLEDVSTYPALFLELHKRGYTDKELRAIAGHNILRVLHSAEKVAESLAEEAASDMLFP